MMTEAVSTWVFDLFHTGSLYSTRIERLRSIFRRSLGVLVEVDFGGAVGVSLGVEDFATGLAFGGVCA